jgi:hypothetical protein
MNRIGSFPLDFKEIKKESLEITKKDASEEKNIHRNCSASNLQIRKNEGSLADFINHHPPVAPENKCDSPKTDYLNGILSPRVYKKTLKIPDLLLQTLKEIKETLDSPFGFPTVSEIEKSMEIYYHQLLNEIIKKPNLKKRYKSNFDNFRAKLNAAPSPIVSLITLHFHEFLTRLNCETELSRQLKNILEILINRGFSNSNHYPKNISHLNVLIELFKANSSKHIGVALSFIIMGENVNQLDELLAIMEKWNQIDLTTFLADLEKQKKMKVCPIRQTEDHTFKVEDIKRTYVTEKILPDRVMINYAPIRLTGFLNNNPNELEREFFSFFLKIIYQSWPENIKSEEELKEILNSLCNNGSIPVNLLNLLGMSSTSAVWLAYESFHNSFPDFNLNLSSSGIASRLKHRDDQAIVEIYFNLNSSPVECIRRFEIILYPSIDPGNKNCYVIDKDSPLAEIKVELVSHFGKHNIKEKNIKNAHIGDLRILSCRFCKKITKITENGFEKEVIKYNATVEQMTFILDQLAISHDITFSLPYESFVNDKIKNNDSITKTKKFKKSFKSSFNRNIKTPLLNDEITLIFNPLFPPNQNKILAKKMNSNE